MKIALFIPCYVDLFYPQVGMSVVKLFERLGLEFSVPEAQSCCGQPLLYGGHEAQAKAQFSRHHEAFRGFDYVVTPSGSCASTLREHPDLASSETKTMELCEFLHDVVKPKELEANLAQKVALHRSCRGIRCLKLGGATELLSKAPCKASHVLGLVKGLELVDLPRKSDECCGFGGAFSVGEPKVSTAMGLDRLELFLEAGAETVTATDMGCLAHLQGIIDKRGFPLRTKHLAELLAENLA